METNLSFSFLNDNATMADLYRFSYRMSFAGAVIFTLIAIVGAIANAGVIYMVIRHKQLKTPMNYFICNLAAADLILLLVLVIPRDINFFTPLQISSIRGALLTTQYIQHVCIQATALILATMSFSRYTMVVFPLKAKAEWTTVRVWLCCVAAWILSILMYTPILFGVLHTHKGGYTAYYIPLGTKIFALLKMVLIFILPFSVIVYCYSKIIITFRKGRYKLKRSVNIDANQTDDQTRKLARMVLIIILIFFLSWAPIQSYLTWLTCRAHTLPTSPTNWRLIEIFGFCFRLSAYLGGAINPFIYAYTNPSFKKVNMFRIRKKKTNESSLATVSSQL